MISFALVSSLNVPDATAFRLTPLMRMFMAMFCQKKCSLSRFLVVDQYPCRVTWIDAVHSRFLVCML